MRQVRKVFTDEHPNEKQTPRLSADAGVSRGVLSVNGNTHEALQVIRVARVTEDNGNLVELVSSLLFNGSLSNIVE